MIDRGMSHPSNPRNQWRRLKSSKSGRTSRVSCALLIIIELLHHTKLKLVKELRDNEVSRALSDEDGPQGNVAHTASGSQSDRTSSEASPVWYIQADNCIVESSAPVAELKAPPNRPASAPASSPAATAQPDKTYQLSTSSSGAPSTHSLSSHATVNDFETDSDQERDGPSDTDDECFHLYLFEALQKVKVLRAVLASEHMDE